MSDNVSAYDQRQYRLMQERLRGYAARKIPLRSLIDDLKSLIDLLESSDSEWKDLALEQWGVLEIIYAVAADRAEQAGHEVVQLTPADQRQLDEAARTLGALVEEKLAR